MRVMLGAGRTVHEGVQLKSRGGWGQRVAALCGAKGNSGRVIRSAAYEVDSDVPVTCKRCLALLVKGEPK
jgi:hypothetical protein